VADNERIAAIAAVLAAIEAHGGETAAIRAAREWAAEQPAPGSGPAISPWALYGRQRIMNMRALMYRRGSSRRV
jgi:hypothetical protein